MRVKGLGGNGVPETTNQPSGSAKWVSMGP